MTQSFEFIVTDEDSGRRLDQFLASRFAAMSRIRIANITSAGACLVNKDAAHAGYRVAAGDHVVIALEEGPPTAMQPERIPIEVVYEDDSIIVVIKPAGMLVHPTKGVKQGTLANALAYHVNKEFYDDKTSGFELQTPAHGQAHSLIRPGLAHRLDRATSGLMVVAKNNRALSRLTIHFRRRLVEKRYLALARGIIIEDEGVIAAPIGRDPDRQPHWWVMENGKAAETRFRVIERLSRATLLELEPVTGRTNQLRIHCAYSGHPIIGDDVYCGLRIVDCGFENTNLVSDTAHSQAIEHIQAVQSAIHNPQSAIRLCLHAARLAFHHPATNEWMDFGAALPEDFASLLHALRNG